MLSLLLLLPSLCSAQRDKIAVKPIDPVTVKRGAKVDKAIDVVVLPGLHVNNDKPRDENIIPLRLSWESGALEAKSISYPKPEEIKVGTQNLLVFTGTFPIKTSFQVSPNAPLGATTISGKIRYQACSSDMCFRPSTIEVKIPVVIE
jgi:hypothetical protein